MDSDKRKLIVHEIEHWRRSRLLPEQYCDFLLNLYLENPNDRDKLVLGLSANTIKNSNWKNWLFLFGGLALISFLVLYFNSFRFPMQIALLLLTVCGCYGLGLLLKDKLQAAAYGLVGLGSAALLGAGVYVLLLHEWLDPVRLLGYVAFCCAVWITVGIAGGMGLFHFCGWIGLLLGYAWLLRSQELSLSWAGAQLSWLPFSVIFGWIGWLLQHRRKKAGTVLFAVSIVLWLAPELYGFYTSGSMDPVFQASFLGKLLLAGFVLFRLRKIWIEWVA